MRLEGKVALITGASSGIGEAAALRFAREGATVVLAARREERLAALAERIGRAGGKADYLAGDVAQEVYAEALVARAVGTFGRLDIAFNNAGTLGPVGSAAVDLTAEDWRATLETNLTGAFLGAKHQLRAMASQRSGSVLFTGSFVGHTIGFPGMAAYGAAKAGLIGLTQCLAAEVGPLGIRVNALLPGGTRTRMVTDFAESPEAIDAVAGFHALKRIADPEEIAAAALFLASDEASFVTGTAFLADGGNSIVKA